MEGESSSSSIVRRASGGVSRRKSSRYDLRRKLEKLVETSDISGEESSTDDMEVEELAVSHSESLRLPSLEAYGVRISRPGSPERTPRPTIFKPQLVARKSLPQTPRDPSTHRPQTPSKHTKILDEVIKQGIEEVKKQSTYLNETIEEVKRQKTEVELTRHLVLNAVAEVQKHQAELKTQQDALKLLIDQSMQTQAEIEKLRVDCQEEAKLLRQAVADKDNQGVISTLVQRVYDSLKTQLDSERDTLLQKIKENHSLILDKSSDIDISLKDNRTSVKALEIKVKNCRDDIDNHGPRLQDIEGFVGEATVQLDNLKQSIEETTQ